MQKIVFVPGAGGKGDFWDPIRSLMHDCETVTLDWPGVNGTSPDPQVGSYDEFANLVAGLFDRPGMLVAQSAGGLPALLVALRRPELVTHLVLIATSAGLDTEPLGVTNWRPGMRAEHPDNPAWIEERVDLTAELADLRMPTLLIWARDDELSPVAVGAQLHQLIANSTLVSFASPDHWVAHEHARDVAALIRRHGEPKSR